MEWVWIIALQTSTDIQSILLKLWAATLEQRKPDSEWADLLQEYILLEHNFEQRDNGVKPTGDWANSPVVEERQL